MSRLIAARVARSNCPGECEPRLGDGEAEHDRNRQAGPFHEHAGHSKDGANRTRTQTMAKIPNIRAFPTRCCRPVPSGPDADGRTGTQDRPVPCTALGSRRRTALLRVPRVRDDQAGVIGRPAGRHGVGARVVICGLGGIPRGRSSRWPARRPAHRHLPRPTFHRVGV